MGSVLSVSFASLLPSIVHLKNRSLVRVRRTCFVSWFLCECRIRLADHGIGLFYILSYLAGSLLVMREVCSVANWGYSVKAIMSINSSIFSCNSAVFNLSLCYYIYVNLELSCKLNTLIGVQFLFLVRFLSEHLRYVKYVLFVLYVYNIGFLIP